MITKQELIEDLREMRGWFIAKDLEDEADNPMPRFIPMRSSDSPTLLAGKLLNNLLAIPYSLVKIAFIFMALVVIGVPFVVFYSLGWTLKLILMMFDKTADDKENVK